ncbi:MAG: RraA family protein [SAR324 cluster bacterium]|nr:RraA family protein [SAR324 cluster bacterium]
MMTVETLNETELKALGGFDTPTICNALEIVAPERRGFGYTVQPMVCPFPELPPMVGYARTATARAMRPAAREKEAVKAQRFAYFDYIAEGPAPRIMVIQDLDAIPGYGAFWGEVQTNVHKALGCLGAITNGSIRDMDAMAGGFQMLGGMVGPSHAWTHLEDYGCEVNVCGMTVASGDLIHADRHGAVIIPHEVARELPQAAQLLGRREAVILEVCKAPGFTVEKLKQAIGDAEDIH